MSNPIIENPVTRERGIDRRTPRTDAEPSVADLHAQPGAAVAGEHAHPHNTEAVAATRDRNVAVAEAAIHATFGGSLAALEEVVHKEATNREAVTEPPDTRGRGPRAFHATGEWLREAFSELVWTTERNITEGDVVVTFGVMSGRHTGDFVVWTEDAHVERVFVPTGNAFSVRQAHFQRIREGLVIEHWAVRDDQGMAMQAGWVPPSLGFLIRCAMATRRARRTPR